MGASFDEALGKAGLSLTIVEGVAHLTVERPESKNSQTPRMWRAMSEVGDELAGMTDSLSCVVVRGRGGFFSSGLDRRMMEPDGYDGQPSMRALHTLPEEQLLATIDSFQDAFAWLHESDVVSIAVVEGGAIGAGAQLALVCDLRLLAEDAYLQFPEAALGLMPDLGGTQHLVHNAGYNAALELCLSGRRVNAAEAGALGLATEVAAADSIDDLLDRTVSSVGRVRSVTRRELKRLLRGAQLRTVDEQRRHEARRQHAVLQHDP